MSDDELQQLLKRIDDIMMGKVQYGESLLMQLDPNAGDDDSEYEKRKLEVGQTVGFKGATRNYRKIGECGAGLECDDLFLAFMKKPIFRNVCNRVYGSHAEIGVYRSMVFNKPAGNTQRGVVGGTTLPFHQDGGDWWALDRDPKCFVWTALDKVDEANGCVKVIRGSHKLGILSARGHTLSAENIKSICKEEDTVNLICEPGESYLVHNWTVHASGTNKTNRPRRAFSCNYIDGRTRVLDPKPANAGSLGVPGQRFPVVFEDPFQSQRQKE
eukprot:g5994.t1